MKKKEQSDTLHLFLKGKWYDMIESGEKKEEYRNADYWCSRIIDQNANEGFLANDNGRTFVIGRLMPVHKAVCFHRGYTNTTMTFRIEGLNYGKPNPLWCEPGDAKKDFLIIKLGKRIK